MAALGPLVTASDTSFINNIIVKMYSNFAPITDFIGFRAFPVDNMSKPQDIFWYYSWTYVCGYLPAVTDFFMGFMAEETNIYNNGERTKVFFGHYPAGSSYNSFNYVSQQFKNGGKFIEFDYGKETNIGVYGQETPPEVHTHLAADCGIPIGMYMAKHDKILMPVDAKYSYDSLKGAVVDYREINGGHLTFMTGKDMTYFKDNIMNLMQKYNPLN